MAADMTEPLIVASLADGIDKLPDGNHRLFKARKLVMTHICAHYLACEEHKRYTVGFDEEIYRAVVSRWPR